MRSGGAAWLAFVLMTIPAAGQEGPRAPAPCTGATSMGADRLREVTPEGDLVLETAGRARLAGVRLPDDGSLRAEAFALLRSAAGRPVVVEGRPERDRWSRIPVVIRPDEPSPSADFARALVEAGLAVVDPASFIPFCHTDLLPLEQEARKRSLGVWGDDRYKPIEAGDTDRLRTSVGRFVLVEGRVRSIGERSQRVYLNFGEHWAEDFTIVIPRKTWKLMGERGLDAAALKGQRIRARGILEPWQGTSLTLLMPEMIERLAGSRLPRRESMSETRHSIGSRIVGSVLLASLLSGCAALGLGTASLPPDAPRVLGPDRGRDRDHERLVAAFGGEVRAPQAQRLLTDITNRLVMATDRPDESYQVTILNSPLVNAFALPNGRLYVTRGLLALANDSSEVAAVLSHEIAHVTLRHASQRNELQARSALIKRVTENVLNDAEQAAVVQDQARSSLASFSRSQELEADQTGVKVLARAGFDPYGAPRFLTALDKASSGPRTDGAEMTASHPSTGERVSRALQAARRAAAPGTEDKGRLAYMSIIDGIPYGDDPADGVVKGRRFSHARLGVAFEAPEGFTLENTSQAVLGSSADGGRRLLFDAADTPNGQSLEEVLRSTWSDTIEPGSLETTTVNGLPVATATSIGKEWSFRLSAIRIGNTTYRLIMAVRSGSGDLESMFQRTLATVRQVQPDEARRIRPLKLQVVTAQEGDTPQRLAERMPIDRALDRFLLLNGLERNAPLKVGERYKIVVE